MPDIVGTLLSYIPSLIGIIVEGLSYFFSVLDSFTLFPVIVQGVAAFGIVGFVVGVIVRLL